MPGRGSRSLLVLALASTFGLAAGCQAGPSPAPASAPATSTAATPAPTGAAQGSPPTAGPSAPEAAELPSENALLPAGRYSLPGFSPRVTFEVEDMVYAPGPVIPGFVAVRRTSSGSDIVIVRFIRPTAIHAGPDATVDATTAAAAVQALRGNAALVDLGTSDSRMSGLTGVVIELEAAAADSPRVMLRGTISFVLEPGLRAWTAFFDTADGLLAIMVQGSGAAWERDLGLVEPLLESVTIGL